MKYKNLDDFLKLVASATGLNRQEIDEANAVNLLRIMNYESVVIPKEIEAEVFSYLLGDYSKRRTHSSSSILEVVIGIDNPTKIFLATPNVREYLKR